MIPKFIVLEESEKGKQGIYESDLTTEFLDKIKADKDDKMGWKKYRKVMKEKGYDIEC